jgi:hypothetical protein
VGLRAGPFSAKVSETVGGSTGWEETNTRSVTNTFTTVSSWSSQETDIYQTTIGNNGEPPGKYRYSLFATTDVYYVLVTDRARTQVIEAYTAVCARPQSLGWGIDYEPNMDGSFAKTANGNLLVIPATILSQLTDPIVELPPPPDLKTFYTETRTNNLEHISSPSHDETVTPGFTTDLLKRFFTKVKIDVSYRFKAEFIWDGGLRLQITSADKTRDLGKKDVTRILLDMNWNDDYYSVTVDIESLNSPTGEFMLLWSKTGNVQYSVGERTISITAIK